jgi:hypothetical protein
MDSFYGGELNEILGGSAWDKVFGGFCVAVRELELLAGGEMVGEPCLSALAFASDPIAHDETLIGVALFLNLLCI